MATLLSKREGVRRNVAISADGTRVVYTGPNSSGPGLQLNVRALDQSHGEPLRGGEGATAPFVSPDGQWVGFISASGNALRRVSISGGSAVTILEYPAPILSATWADDDQILFGAARVGLFRVAAGGGDPESVATVDRDRGETAHTEPFFIPGRNAVLFVINEGTNLQSGGQLAALDLETRQVTKLGLAGISPHYVSTGHLVYATLDGSLRGVSFDVTTLEVTGTPVPLIADVTVKIMGSANFAVSENGRLVFVSDTGQGQRSVVFASRDGTEEVVTGLDADAYESLDLSPDGERLLLGGADGNLWTYDMVRGIRNRLRSEVGQRDQHAIWTSDGSGVVFRRGGTTLMRRPSDGAGVVEELLSPQDGVGGLRPGSWLPDGRLLLQGVSGDFNNVDVAAMSMDGDREIEVLIATAGNDGAPVVSPDGQWIAYHSDVSGRYEVYVDRFPALGDRRQISSDGGVVPRWSPDGRELFYGSRDGRQLLVVAVSTDPVFSAGAPEVLLEGSYLAPTGNRRPYDVTADGQQFVMVKTAASEAQPEIAVVINWFEELTRLVPSP